MISRDADVRAYGGLQAGWAALSIWRKVYPSGEPHNALLAAQAVQRDLNAETVAFAIAKARGALDAYYGACGAYTLHPNRETHDAMEAGLVIAQVTRRFSHWAAREVRMGRGKS